MPKRKKGAIEFRYILILFIIVIVLAFIVVQVALKLVAVPVCNDGTTYNSCSEIKPYYCQDGLLVEKASLCGCSNVTLASGDSCVLGYQTNPEQVKLNYILRGEEHEIDFSVYQNVYDYVSEVPREIVYQAGEVPSRLDFKLKSISEERQREFLKPLVIEILNAAESREDAVRIAVGVAQNIPYKFSNKTSVVGNLETNYSRYPYEVLYEQEGICGEKSALLSFLLKEIGYGTAIFYFPSENHEAVGVKCPVKKSFSDTGYCFVETSGPAIISDGSLNYEGGITLNSQPEVIVISDGDVLSNNLYEYKDAQTLERIREGRFVLFRDSKFNSLKEKYGLVEEYRLA